MKISNYFKRRGEEVQLFKLEGKTRFLPTQNWESVWISCVFTWNRWLAEFCKELAESQGWKTEIGGSGINLTTKLPSEIEADIPDYSLYGDDRAVGFVQRGCIRKCQFCIVPQKEGRLADNEYRPLKQ